MPVSGYAKKLAPPGDLPEGIIKWQGPTSYTVITAGNPPSGGDTLPSIVFGVDEILGIEFQGTYTGNFTIVPVRIASNKWALQWRALRTATIGGQSQTTGQEAVATTNLSAEYVNFRVITRAA